MDRAGPRVICCDGENKPSGRKLSPADKQRYPHSVVMVHKDLGIVIVPGVTLRAMHQISFTSLMKLTPEADTEIRSLHLYMRQLCIAIIRNEYNFEDPTDQD